MHRIARRLLVAAAALGSAPAAAWASPAEDVPRSFGETIDVRVVNVEVVVTERSGRRVPDLTPEDFRLLVDGQPIAVEFFTEVREGQAVRSRSTNGPLAGSPAGEAGEAVGTSYLVFIDDYFAIGAHRDLVLARLREQVGALGREDRVAVVAWAGGRLERLADWTGSAAELDRAFAAALARPAWGLWRGFELSRAAEYGDDSVGRYQLRLAVSAATAGLRGLGQAPGRRVMLLLAGGWPVSLGLDPYGRELLGTLADETDLDLLRPLIEAANLLSFTLYPIDVSGLRVEVEVAGEGPRPTGAAGFALEREAWRHSQLRYLARETGGRALLAGDRLAAFPKVAEDTRSYYWLGFTPSWNGDDARHEVRVEVRRRGLAARARRGFQDRSPQAEAALLVEGALFFGEAPGVEPLAIGVGAPRPAAFGRMWVPVAVTIRPEEITPVPTATGFGAMLEVRVAVLDADGGMKQGPMVPLWLTGDSRVEADEGPLRYEITLKMRRKPHDLVVSVREPATGRVLLARTEVRP